MTIHLTAVVVLSCLHWQGEYPTMGTQCRTHLEGKNLKYYMVPGILPMLYIGNSPVHHVM